MVPVKTVLDILACAASLAGFLPLMPHLERTAVAGFFIALVLRIATDRIGRSLPERWATPLSIGIFVLYAARFTLDNVVGPAANLITLLLGVRLIGQRSARHYLQIAALALFLLAASSLFTLSATFLVYLGILFVLIPLMLVFLTAYDEGAVLHVSRDAFARMLKTGFLMPAMSAPLLLLFFVILPRTQFPLWNFLAPGGSATAGFQDTVTPGRSASVGEGGGVAFRVATQRLPAGKEYWRCIVLNEISGRTWKRSNPPQGEKLRVPSGAPLLRQTVFQEDAAQRFLPAANVPVEIQGVRAGIASDHTITRGNAWGSKKVRYDVVSAPTELLPGNADAEFYLRTPAMSPRMQQVADDIRRRGKDAASRLDLAERFFIGQKLTYARTDLSTAVDPLDDFLFQRKRGHCEFFAASLGTLLRASGVPARLVGGYLGGDYNEMGGYYLVTQEMAHVWVEAFVEGKGWVTLDPVKWAAGYEQPLNRKQTLMRKLGLAVDSFNYFWNVTVVNFDLEKQISLASAAGNSMRRLDLNSLRHAAVPFASVLAGVSLIIAGLRFLRRDPRSVILSRFSRRVASCYGVDVAACGLFATAAQTADEAVRHFVSVYASSLYRDEPMTVRERKVLQEAIGRIGRAYGR